MTFDFRCSIWLQRAMAVAMLGGFTYAQAALFSDDEARQAILDLRQRVEALRQAGDANDRRRTDETEQIRRSLIDLQSQIETLRAEQARLRGQYEELARSVAEVQRAQLALAEKTDGRLRALEPQKVSVDGREFAVTADERRAYEGALAQFRNGEFAAAAAAFQEFLRRYPESGYQASVLFWLGNAQYATRAYKDAVANLRAMLKLAPDHPRAPDALLAIANCQQEMKDVRAARAVLDELIKTYPKSEAAAAARERLARLR